MPSVPPYHLTRFRGAPDTLAKMREHVWGPRGEKSLLVRQLTERVVGGVWSKDYLSEILAIRFFATAHLTLNLRYTNDPAHVEWIKDPERIATELLDTGESLVDCEEIAELVATMALQVGRVAEFVVVGFGAPGEYSHVFARVSEPKSGAWIVCDPVAGSDEEGMLAKVTTAEVWSLDDYAPGAPLPGYPGREPLGWRIAA